MRPAVERQPASSVSRLLPPRKEKICPAPSPSNSLSADTTAGPPRTNSRRVRESIPPTMDPFLRVLFENLSAGPRDCHTRSASLAGRCGRRPWIKTLPAPPSLPPGRLCGACERVNVSVSGGVCD